MRGVIYARYSSDRQTEQSIEGQLRDCEAYAEKHDIQIIEVYADRAKTGRNSNRAEFQRMLRDSKNKTFDCVLVWKIDRFGRNRDEIVLNRYILSKNDVKVISCMESIPEDKTGILIGGLFELIAEYYSVDLSEKVMRGMTVSAEKCQAYGTHPPLGYKVDKNKKYVLDENTKPIVELLYNLFDSGMSKAEIIRYCKEHDIKPPRAECFTYKTLDRIFTNPFYIGVYKWGEIEVPDGVPRIISNEQFERVQRRMTKDVNCRRVNDTTKFLLTGKIFCGHCGSSMHGDSGKSKTGNKFYYYSCRTRKKYHTCNKKSVPKEWIETEVARTAMEAVLNERMIDVMTDSLIEYQEKMLKDDSLLNRYKSELKEVEKNIDNIVKSIMGGLQSKALSKQLEELEIQQEELQIKIAKEEAVKPKFDRADIAKVFNEFKHGDYTDPKFQERLFDTFLDKVILYDDKFTITFNFTDNQAEVPLEEIEKASEEAIEKCSDKLPIGSPKATKSNTKTAKSRTPCVFIVCGLIGVTKSL